MSTNSVAINGQSPFDAIKQTREYGSEFWSARRLQPLMGYARWEDFAKIVRRAITSATNSGTNGGFSEITEEPSAAGGRPRANFELSRFAAYLVAMNGDPNMPEVAAAQAYFAIKTREAEIAQPIRELTFEEKTLEVLSGLQKMVEAKDEQIAVLEPKADAYSAFIDADGTYSVGNVAKMLGLSQNKLFDLMRNAGVMISKGAMRNTPYQKYMHHFAVKAFDFERSDGTRGTSYTTRIQPSGVDFIRKKIGLEQPLLAV